MKNKLRNWFGGEEKQGNEENQGAIWGFLGDVFSDAKAQSANLKIQPEKEFYTQAEEELQVTNLVSKPQLETINEVLQIANLHPVGVDGLVTLGILYLYNNQTFDEESKEAIYELLKSREDYETVVSYDTRKRHERQARNRANKSN